MLSKFMYKRIGFVPKQENPNKYYKTIAITWSITKLLARLSNVWLGSIFRDNYFVVLAG